MIEVARRENPGIEFVLGDAEELPFGADEFDAVLANFVFNHLPQPERAAAELARVLRPAGRVAFSIWDEDERNRWYGLARETLAEVGESRPGALPAGAPDPTRFAEEVRGPRAARRRRARPRLRHAPPRVQWPAPSGESLWANLLAGSVRTAARIQAQDAETQRRIRELFTKRAEEEFRSGEELLLRASVMIASAGAHLSPIPQVLRAAIAAGEFGELAPLYAEAATLDASVRGRRVRRRGREAVIAELARLYPVRRRGPRLGRERVRRRPRSLGRAPRRGRRWSAPAPVSALPRRVDRRPLDLRGPAAATRRSSLPPASPRRLHLGCWSASARSASRRCSTRPGGRARGSSRRCSRTAGAWC